MNNTVSIRTDKQTEENIKYLIKELNISRSDIVRMAIANFKKYVEKVNK